MRRTIGFLAVGGVLAVAAATSNSGSLLGSFAKALHDADTLSSTYTVQIVGGAADHFTVSLKKPNFARIETPAQTIVATGKEIITFEKSSKQYFRQPQTEQNLKSLFAGDELNLFSGFFDMNAYNAVSVKDLGKRSRKGQPVQAVQASMDAANKKTVTFMLSGDNIARTAQISLNDPNGKVEIIVDTRTLDLNASLPGERFAFNAPDGSQEMSLEELNAAKWYSSIEEAIQVAQRTNKKIFVDFYADWCGPCKLLDAQVLKTEGFKKLSSNLVFVKIDVDRQPSVAQAYKVTAMPTQMVLDKNGQILSTKVGYGSPADFYGWLRPNL
jgi:thiol-disulfide isomerase/thioredoxin